MAAAETTDPKRIQFTGVLERLRRVRRELPIKDAFRYVCLNPAGGFDLEIIDAAMWLI
jgi:hypothetical protein